MSEVSEYEISLCAPDTDNIHRYVLFRQDDDVLWRFGERKRTIVQIYRGRVYTAADSTT